MYYVIFRNKKGNLKVVKSPCETRRKAYRIRDDLPEEYEAIVVSEASRPHTPRKGKSPILDLTGFKVTRIMGLGHNGANDKWCFVDHRLGLATTSFKDKETLLSYKNSFFATETALRNMRNRYLKLFGGK